MIARLGLFASLLLMLVTVPRPAQARALCNAAHARAATIEAVQANYGIYAGRCVRLRGLAVRFGMSRTLYADRNAVLDQVSAPVGQTPRAIAIYPARVDHVPWRAAMVEIVGTLGTCAGAHDVVRRWMVDHPGSIMDVGGYCHGSDTDYIRPVSIRIVDSAPVVRLT